MPRADKNFANTGLNMIQALAENPVALIEQGAPRRIHTDAQLSRYTEVLFRLTAKESPSPAEQETIDLLTLLIEDYERKYRLPQGDPVSVLKHLMQAGGLLQQDLRPELGSISNISMILSGQRGLTLSNASALATRFGVDLTAFLPKPATASERHSKSHAKRTRPSKANQPNLPKAFDKERIAGGRSAATQGSR